MPARFTIQFHESDPAHQQVAEILNRQGRRKAQFLVNAVQHDLHCPETPDLMPVDSMDTPKIETIVRRILAEMESLPLSSRTTDELRKNPQEKPDVLSTGRPLPQEEMSTIAASLAMFRK